MKKQTNDNKVSINSEGEPRGSLALVLRADITMMPEIVCLVRQVPRTKIVYQRVSGGRLNIVEEK